MEGDGWKKEGRGINGTGNDVGSKHFTSNETRCNEAADGKGGDGGTIKKRTGGVELRRKRECAENEIV